MEKLANIHTKLEKVFISLKRKMITQRIYTVCWSSGKGLMKDLMPKLSGDQMTQRFVPRLFTPAWVCESSCSSSGLSSVWDEHRSFCFCFSCVIWRAISTVNTGAQIHHKCLCVFVNHSHQCIDVAGARSALDLEKSDAAQHFRRDALGNSQTAAGNGTNCNKK